MTTISDNKPDELPRDDEIESRARAIFRNACEGADSYHTLRLGLARRRALAAGTGHSALRVWAPLTGAAACCALALGVVWMRPAQHALPGSVVASSMSPAAGQTEDEVIPEVSSEQMEMVENLDFYRWLATQQASTSVPNGGGR